MRPTMLLATMLPLASALVGAMLILGPLVPLLTSDSTRSKAAPLLTELGAREAIAQQVTSDTESADPVLGVGVNYWMRSVSLPDVGQNAGGVRMRVMWVGIAEAANLPRGIRSGLSLDILDYTAIVGIQVRVENTSGESATLLQLDQIHGFAIPYTSLTSNIGPLRARNFSNAEGRVEIPNETYRTYDLLFFSTSPSQDLESFCHSPRALGHTEGESPFSFRPARPER
jgi:hypothetical protein